MTLRSRQAQDVATRWSLQLVEPGHMLTWSKVCRFRRARRELMREAHRQHLTGYGKVISPYGVTYWAAPFLGGYVQPNAKVEA